ncbi:hypothetical protein PG993_003940 [Apiospora rasikravindrae]|uniref:DUF7770 domain-containing protein n=1 Tax=Apiospora rasikravindrae TaxID=990691 RepID=A0ABR1U0X6_9PEZI
MSSAILDNNWDLDVSNEALHVAVQKVHICALRNEFNEGEDDQPPTNHWVICLQTSPKSSIMLDIAPGYGEDGLRGKILVTLLDRSFTDETLRHFTYTPERPIEVKDILSIIQAKSRQAYTFSPEWEGCRYWISVVIDDLESEGILTDASKDALGKLSMYWICPDGQEPREMRKGNFSSSVNMIE